MSEFRRARSRVIFVTDGGHRDRVTSERGQPCPRVILERRLHPRGRRAPCFDRMLINRGCPDSGLSALELHQPPVMIGKTRTPQPGLALCHNIRDISGTVASMTGSDPGVLSEKAPNHALVLTGTAVRGGQAVWMFSET